MKKFLLKESKRSNSSTVIIKIAGHIQSKDPSSPVPCFLQLSTNTLKEQAQVKHIQYLPSIPSQPSSILRSGNYLRPKLFVWLVTANSSVFHVYGLCTRVNFCIHIP